MKADPEDIEEFVEAVIKGYGWSITSPRAIRKGGAPMIEGPGGDNIRVPDTEATHSGRKVYVETKGKGSASLHRKTGDPTHGIDTVAWDDYKRANRISGQRVYIFVYEEDKGMLLRRCIGCLHTHHTHPNGGGDGEAMTYFDRDELERVPLRQTWVTKIKGVSPQINLKRDPEYIDFKLFPHEMDGATGESTTLGSFGIE